MRRIAFFGGSFDPPHMGHLAIAKAAADRFALDEVLFAPVANQPLKGNLPATAFLHRYAMTALAAEADPRFTPSLLDAPADASPDEASSPEPEHRPEGAKNYTVGTLERLRGSLGDRAELFMLLGADSWLQIARWRDPVRLLALCDWIVAARPGFSLSNAGGALPEGVGAELVPDPERSGLLLQHSDGHSTRVFLLEEVRMDISGTKLRAELQARGSGGEQIPAAVREYIRKTGLYSREAGSGRQNRF